MITKNIKRILLQPGEEFGYFLIFCEIFKNSSALKDCVTCIVYWNPRPKRELELSVLNCLLYIIIIIQNSFETKYDTSMCFHRILSMYDL